jgi:hypothetical protein
MKRFNLFFAVLFVIAWTNGYAGSTYSSDPRFTDEKLQVIEKSLRCALESENFGLQTSASQVIRDVKSLVPRYEFSSLVIPLMRIVKDEAAQPANRILAVLALHDLGSERGDFAIKRVGKFADVGQLKHLCMALTPMSDNSTAEAERLGILYGWRVDDHGR